MKTDKYEVVFSFNNTDFERNVQTSMGTLDKLKNGLKFPDAEKGFQKITAASKSFSLSPIGDAIESIKNRFSGFGIVGMTVIQNLTNSVMGFAKKTVGQVINPIVEGGLKRAQNLEQAQFMLEGLLGKTEEGSKKIEEIMGAVQRSVKGTAYGLGDAAKVASQLVASGIEDSGKMESVLRGIAGTAAMTGSSFDEIGHIFTTVSSNGKLMTEQLRQFSYRGLNVSAQLAKELQVTEEEINDMVSQGAIDFETFATAMDAAFGEHAKDANQTYAGSLANVQAALSRIGESFQTPKLERMKNIFNALIPMIDAIHEKLKPFIAIINEVLDKGADKAINFINKITDLLGGAKKEVTEAVDGTAESIENASGVISKSAEEIEEAAQRVLNGEFGTGEERRRQLEELGYSYEEVQNKVNELLGVDYRYEVAEKNLITTTEQVTEKTDELTGSVEELNKSHLQNTLSNFISGFKHVKQAITDFIDIFKNGIINAFSGQGSKFLESIERISDKFREFAGNLILATSEKEGLERIFTFIFTVVRNIALVGLKVIEVILTILNFGARLGRKILDFIGHLRSFNEEAEKTSRVSRFFEALKGVFERIGSSIKTFFERLKEVGNKIKDTEGYKKLTDALTKLHDAVHNVIEKLKELLGKVIDKIIEKMENFGKGKDLKFSWMDVLVTIVDKLAGALAFLIEKITAGARKIKAFFGFFKDSETGKFKSFSQIVSDVKEKFKSFLESFKGDGTGKFSKFVETLKGFKDRFKELLHIDGSETSVLGAVKNFFTFIKDTIGSKFDKVPGVLGKLKEGFSNLWNSLKTGNVSEFLSQIKEIASEKFEKFIEALGKFKERLKEIFNLDSENVTALDIIKGFFNFLKEVVSEKLGKVPGILDTLKKAFSGLFGGLTKDNISGFFENLKEMAGGKFAAFIDKLSTMKDHLKEVLHLDGDNISAIDVIKGFFNFFKDLATGKSGSILDFLGRVKDGFLEFFTGINLEGTKTDILGGIQNKFSEAISGIGEFFAGIDVSGFVDGVKSFFSKVSEAFADVDMDKVLEVLGKLGKTIGTIILFFSTLRTLKSIRKLADKAGGTLESLSGAFQHLGSMFDSIGTMFTSIKGFFDGMGETLQKMARDKMNMEKAKIFIAGIVAIVGSIWVLSKIPKEDLIRSVETLVGVMAGMAGAMAIIAAMPAQSSSFKDIGAAFAGLGVGLLAVTAALKILGGMDLQTLLQGAIAVVSIMLLMGTAARIAGSVKAAAAFMGLAIAIDLLVPALAIIGMMPWENIEKGAVAIGVIAFELAIAARAVGSVKAAAAFMGLAVAVDLLVPALAIIGLMPWDNIAKGLVGIGGVMLSLAAAIRIASSPVSSKGATNMLKLTVPLVAAIVGLKLLANIPWQQMVVGAGGIAAVMFTLAGALKLAKGGGTGANNMLKMTVPLAVAIAGLAVLANMPMKGLIAGAACVAGVLGVLIAAFKLCKGGSKGADNMLKLTVPLGVACAGLAVLANMPIKGLIAGAACLAGVLGVLAGLTYVVKGAKDGAMIMLMLTGTLAAAIAGLYILAQQPWENLLAAAAALGGVFLGLAGAIAILSAVPLPAGIAAVLLLDVFIISIIAIVGTVGYLFGPDGPFAGVMKDAIGVMTDFGDAIGGFIEKIMEHIGQGVATNIEQLADALEYFGQHIGPFVDAARTIDAEVLAGIGRLALALVEITGAEIFDAIYQFVAQESSIESFGKELVAFAVYLNDYYSRVKDITKESLDPSIQAVEALVGMVGNVTGGGIAGGIKGFFQGNPLKHFGEELAAFGPNLYSYSTYAVQVSEEAVNGSARAGSMLATMYKNVTDSGISGGILGFLEGNPLKHFGEELAAFGPNMLLYSQSAEGVNEDAVIGSANAATMAAYMYKAVMDSGISGGLLGFLEGNPLKHLGEELAAFGPNILKYSQDVASVDSAAVTSSSNAAQIAAYMYKAVKESGITGATGLLSEKPLAHFGEELAAFGPGILTYSAFAAKVKVASIQNVNQVLPETVAVTDVVNNASYDYIVEYGNNLRDFGQRLLQYFISVRSIEHDKVAAAIKTVYNLIAMGKTMEIVDTETMTNFGTALADVALNGIDDFINAFSGEALANAKVAVCDFVSNAASGVSAYTAAWYGIGVDMANGMINGLNNSAWAIYQTAANIAYWAAQTIRNALQIASPSKVMYEIGEYTVEGMALGMKDCTGDIKARSEEVANTIVDSVAKPINELQNAMEEGIDVNPVITPVMDLSSISSGTDALGTMLGDANVPISLAGNLGGSMIDSILNLANKISENQGTQESVVNAISGLRSDVNALGDRMSRMQLMLDGKTLVGGIIEDVDTALGDRLALAQRGV